MDFDAPLGMEPPPRPRRRLVLAAVGGLALAGAGGVAVLLSTADPRGGEPTAVAALPVLQPRRPAPPPAIPVDPTPTGSLAPAASLPTPPVRDGRFAGDGSLENGVRVFRGATPAGFASTATAPAEQPPLVIDVTRSLDGGKRKAGPSGGATASAVAGTPTVPRVAIFIEGMGPSRDTQRAIDTMPPGVTLAFLPYGNNVAAEVAAAKGKGHEVLLQLPMQNIGGMSPGPHALRPGEPAETLADDLGWLTGRFSGYDGMVNLLGAPVMADQTAMNAVLRAAAGRGQFFLDDGTAKRSLASSLSAPLGVPVVRADLVLDATDDPAILRANLDQLVAIARRKGSAIGMASGLPEHLGAIARFAAGLAAANVTLVPVGTLARGGTTVAAASR